MWNAAALSLRSRDVRSRGQDVSRRSMTVVLILTGVEPRYSSDQLTGREAIREQTRRR